MPNITYCAIYRLRNSKKTGFQLQVQLLCTAYLLFGQCKHLNSPITLLTRLRKIALLTPLGSTQALKLYFLQDWQKKLLCTIFDSTLLVCKEINWKEEADAFGRKCLSARRLLERGVKFVQIWSGNDNGFPRRNWDSHEDI